MFDYLMYSNMKQETSKSVSEESEDVPLENLPMAKKVEELEKMRKRRAKRNTIALEQGEMNAFSYFFVGKPNNDKTEKKKSPRF